MSVGYDYAGIRQPNVQAFLEGIHNASPLIEQHVEGVAAFYPEVRDLDLPGRVSNSVTLSTMHGCPPDEIEKICAYLLGERGLHTSVKLNPTLLGPDAVRDLLNRQLGYREVEVPDGAFEHDLKWDDAVPMLRRLQALATERGLAFGVKLTNTLEVLNTRQVFDASEKQMYLSGRPLHVITAHLAARLSEAFDGRLPMSFSAGADAFNIADLIRCGMKTVTVCSDLLKSGGYLRLLQYLANLDQAMAEAGAADLSAFIRAGARRAPGFEDRLRNLLARPAWRGDPEAGRTPCCALIHLQDYAAGTSANRLYRKDTFLTSHSKTARGLGFFDCIEAPCTDECPVDQDVPAYMRAVREGRIADAVEITRRDNPLPSILGRVCDHLCEHTCVRTHLDEPLAIRDMKRYIMEQAARRPVLQRRPPNGRRVAIIGGGPAGLAAAYQLAPEGFAVTLFEAHPYAGGMVAGTIPTYRLPQYVIEEDLHLLTALGIEIRYGCRAGTDVFQSDLQRDGYEAIVVTVGAQQGKRLGIDGEAAEGVLDALDLLRAIREGRPVPLGRRIGVIGAGDTAMDCARSSWRLTRDSEVHIIYRRTVDQMPADREEIRGLLEEGIGIVELASPTAIRTDANGRLAGLVCNRCRLGAVQADGRRAFEQSGETFELPLDTLILAISQNSLFDFFDVERPALTPKGYLAIDEDTMACSVPGLYAGGDAAGNGPASIVKACGDGKKIAAALLAREDKPSGAGSAPVVDVPALMKRRATRAFRTPVPHRPPDERKDFGEVAETYGPAAAVREADRCLDCDLLCSICVGVCPNLAILTYRSEPLDVPLPRVRCGEGRAERVGEERQTVRQAYQVAVLTDFCNECGNCVTFCPTAGAPYRDKPRLYLNREEWAAEPDNAFMLFPEEDGWRMEGRFGGRTHVLQRRKARLEYRSPGLQAHLNLPAFDVAAISAASPVATGEHSLRPAAEMYLLAEGVLATHPCFPRPAEASAS